MLRQLDWCRRSMSRLADMHGEGLRLAGAREEHEYSLPGRMAAGRRVEEVDKECGGHRVIWDRMGAEAGWRLSSYQPRDQRDH